jgi:predicted amidohydrolase YtcJ
MSGDADVIYTGGDIVTVNEAQPTAEAVAGEHGRIVAVGPLDSVVAEHRGPDTRLVDGVTLKSV